LLHTGHGSTRDFMMLVGKWDSGGIFYEKRKLSGPVPQQRSEEREAVEQRHKDLKLDGSSTSVSLAPVRGENRYDRLASRNTLISAATGPTMRHNCPPRYRNITIYILHNGLVV